MATHISMNLVMIVLASCLFLLPYGRLNISVGLDKQWTSIIQDLWHYMAALGLNFLKRNLFNTLRPRQNGRHFADDIFKCIFLNQISLKFVPKDPINNIPALVQTMAWRRPGNKPLSEPMLVSLLTNICVTRPRWVKMCVSQVSPRWRCLSLLVSQITTRLFVHHFLRLTTKNMNVPFWRFIAVWNPPTTGGIPTQKVPNEENISM